MDEPIANSGDTDQTPRSAASDLGLYYLLITILGVARLQWVNSSLNFKQEEFRMIASYLKSIVIFQVDNFFPAIVCYYELPFHAVE